MLEADGRVPPNDMDAEAAVLSAAILSPDACDSLRGILRAEHFYAGAHRFLFEAIEALADIGKPVDILTIRSWLSERGKLDAVGGATYLAQILDAAPALSNIEEYAHMVRDKWRLRQLIESCRKRAAMAYGQVESVQSFCEDLEAEAFALTEQGTSLRVVSMREAVREYGETLLHRLETGAVDGTLTGYCDFDRMTQGLPAGLVIVAGRPAMGKTAWALNVADNVAREGGGGLIVSLEMPRDQLVMRWACTRSRIPITMVRECKLDGDARTAYFAALKNIHSLPVDFCDESDVGLAQVRSMARRTKARLSREGVPMRFVIVDYLQLMRTKAERGKSREREISELSRGLKVLSKELDCSVVAVSQLNRGVEQRGKDKRPMLSDLRESGAIEQDADLIAFLYRDEYYNKDSKDKNVAEVIVAKQRNGPTGTARLRFSGACNRFDNLEEFPE